ncbi:MAG: Zn-ribbon containing protein [Candidatus Aenigmatarchaeota archaeon]
MHKCVRCGSVFSDEDPSILRGCAHCGSIFFLYLRNQQDEIQVKEIEEELASKQTTLEKEVERKIGEEVKRVRKREFGIETVRMPKEGVYEINLDALMQKKPLIVLEKGKIYLIHLPSVFEAE